MTRPNPLTDELSDEAKAELAVEFAELRERYYAQGHLLPQPPQHVRRLMQRRSGW